MPSFFAMIQQVEIVLPPFPKGFHIITREILAAIGTLPESGLLHLFIRHTSAGICVNENADPTVLDDFETVFNKLVPENQSYYLHTDEGPDDMPAHIKSVLTGTEITVPVMNGRLMLGTWQGIYLCEFRNRGGARRLIASLVS